MLKEMTTKTNKINYEFKKDVNYEYFTLKMLAHIPFSVYTIRNIYKNTKSKYGEQWCIVASSNAFTDDIIINMPSFYNDLMREILENTEICKSIEAGNEKFRVIERVSKTNKTYYAIEFIE